MTLPTTHNPFGVAKANDGYDITPMTGFNAGPVICSGSDSNSEYLINTRMNSWTNQVKAFRYNATDNTVAAISFPNQALSLIGQGVGLFKDSNYVAFVGGNTMSAAQTGIRFYKIDGNTASLLTAPTAMTASRRQPVVGCVGNFLVINGGATSTSGNTLLSTLEAYKLDPEAGTLTKMTSGVPASVGNRRNATTLTVGNMLYIVGGESAYGTATPFIYRYGATATALTRYVDAPQMAEAKLNVGVCKVGNYLVCAGGRLADYTTQSSMIETFKINANGSLTAVAGTANMQNMAGQVAAVEIDGKLVLFGGSDGTFAEVYEIDDATGAITFIETTDVPNPNNVAYFMKGATFENLGVVFGGQNASAVQYDYGFSIKK